MGYPYPVNQRLGGGTNLLDKRICITGSFDVPRSKIEDFIISQGGIVTSKISKTTDYLLCGDSPKSKLDKAKELHGYVTIVYPSSFDDIPRLLYAK